jgi:hypothetical protein
MIAGDNDWATGWNISQAFYLGTKSQHQKWSQECTQHAVWKIVYIHLHSSSLRNFCKSSAPNLVDTNACATI